MFLDLIRGIIRSVARFRLCAHTLQVETVTWNHNTSPTCALCNANDVQDEQHVFFHCSYPHVVSLQDSCVPICSRRFPQCVCFSGPGKQAALLLPSCTYCLLWAG